MARIEDSEAFVISCAIRGSLEHKRFVYLVYRACSLPAWLVSFLNHALSCTRVHKAFVFETYARVKRQLRAIV